MSLTRLVSTSLQHGYSSEWRDSMKDAFDSLLGAPNGRYPADAKKLILARIPDFKDDSDVPFAAYIHSSNPMSGPYGGMSIAIFPVPNAPCLISFVVGTQGLAPDEDILGRPGHARKVQALCSWLNRTLAHGKLVAWAKQEPVRADQDVPRSVVEHFTAYRSVFEKYGRVLYGIFAPVGAKDARDAIAAFLDLMFEERKVFPLAEHRPDRDRIRLEWTTCLMRDLSESELSELLRSRRYVILQGPPGVGKTRTALRLLNSEYKGRGTVIQFHANTTYETFVGGLAPRHTEQGVGLNFEPLSGTLMNAAAAAMKSKEPNLLVIDEINRADLSKVLGEAIFLLESESEMQRTVQLPYDFGSPFNSEFHLPPNLHILGTMNTADRSLAVIDVAIRRRFAFAKLWPQMNVVKFEACGLMVEAFGHLLDIFVEYAGTDAFDLLPGHSYFLEADEQAARKRLKVTLAPLLEEYLNQGYVTSFAEPLRSYLQWIESL